MWTANSMHVLLLCSLFRPPGPALAGRAGLYILLLSFFSFFAGTYRWQSAQQASADTIPAVGPPALLIKYPQTFDPYCPPFTGGKTSLILAQISTQVVFGPPYFWTTALYRKSKKLVKDWWYVYHHTKLGIGRPQLLDPLAQWVPQRVKVENFLYILHSSSPRRVQHRQCYTTCWSRSRCEKTTVLCLPIRPLHFTVGKNRQTPSVNLGPHHISTINRARKLKFFTDIDSDKYSFSGRKIFPGCVRGCSAP